MLLQNGDSQDSESKDAKYSSENGNTMTNNNDDNDSDAASADSDTPLMELKRAKMRKQKEEEERDKKKKTQQQKGKRKTTSPTKTLKSTENGKKAATKTKPKQQTTTTTKKATASPKPTKAKATKKTATPTKAKAEKKPQTTKTTASPKPTKAKASAKQSSAKTDTKKSPSPAKKSKKTNDASPSTKKKEESKPETTDDSSMHSSDSEEEEAACCMCHCGVDCSDRALFFSKDRKTELEEDEDYYFGMKDPYLDGDKFYDRNNALVYCDTCNRLYHQKCHFVPLLVVPRGEFHCLICTIQQQKLPKKSPKKHKPTAEPTIPEQFLKRKITDQLFQSPPNPSTETLDVKALQHEWEVTSGHAKAKLWNLQFKQLRTFLKSQASNIRMANTTLATMTSTKRNRQHFLQTKAGTKSSQELAQTLCKLTGAKFKIREAFLSLESMRVKNESIDFDGLNEWCQTHPEHATHVFPFGSDHCKKERRIVPRTRERKQDDSKKEIPTEITLGGGDSSKASAKKTASRSKKGEKKTKDKDDDDDDSGITLDDLQCAVCMIGDATDENDVLLCDGKDCHRAFHMKCVYPHVKQEDIENEDEDWFCPICSQSAELLGEIHGLCEGDDDDGASIESWDDVHEDVFPGSQWEFETAQKILKGKRNEDTQRLLTMFLGEDIHKKKVQMPVGSDSEDEEDYSLFDENSFQERRRQEKDEQSFEDSVASSEATLQDYDDIDYKVRKTELDALSEEEASESDSDEDSDDDSENRVRRSRRLEKKEEEDEPNPLGIGADFDEANILDGKRKRKRVNYRKLNDMMFGDLSDHQQANIDGGDDFDAPKKAKTESDNESGNNESGSEGSGDESGDESGEGGSDDGSDNGSDDGSDDGSGDESENEESD